MNNLNNLKNNIKTLKLHNTLTRKLEEFIPIDKDSISIYHCGPTVYSTQHIGNMRAAYFGDIVHRSLKYLGYNPKYVRNYTDVGHLDGDNAGSADSGTDRMEKGAKKEGITVWDVAQKYIDQFNSDIEKLGNISATIAPRATENIKEQIEIVKILLDKGFAYITEDAVYFDTSKATDYTRLSHQKMEENISGRGHGDADQSNKRNPQDFALWIFRQGEYKNHSMHWNTNDENNLPQFYSNTNPDGDGFPGWHIECSAMIKKFLGNTIDIHIGGVEHIPVHHTNEIAQSENANDAPFVHYWLHNEHLLIDNKKMSKSEGKAYIIKDIEEQGYSALDLRYFFLNAHYRSPQNFTWDALNDAKTSYSRLKEKYILIEEQVKKNETHEINEEFEVHEVLDNDQYSNYRNQFIEFISTDFNTTGALSVIWNLFKDTSVNNITKLTLIKEWNEVLGLQLDKKDTKPVSKHIDDETKGIIEDLIQRRNKLRKDRDYATADKLKDMLLKYNIELEDSQFGTTWRAK